MIASIKRVTDGKRSWRQAAVNEINAEQQWKQDVERAKQTEKWSERESVWEEKNWTNNRIITILQTFSTTYDRSHKFTTYLLVSSKGCLFHNAFHLILLWRWSQPTAYAVSLIRTFTLVYTFVFCEFLLHSSFHIFRREEWQYYSTKWYGK